MSQFIGPTSKYEFSYFSRHMNVLPTVSLSTETNSF